MNPIATISETKKICEQYGLYIKKKFGQNFIIEPKIVEKIAKEAIPDKSTIMLEIGPGIGALTQYLSLNAYKVISFEIDESLKQYWKENIFHNTQIIFEDFLSIHLDDFFKQYQNETFAVAANLPYYITTPILFKLFNYHFKKITVMMQKEVAMRFSAKVNTKQYNALSVISQYKYDIQIAFYVSRTVFIPVPNVDSAIVTFVEKQNRSLIDEEKFYAFVHECFVQRRKTIYNNLRHYPFILEVLEECGVSSNTRAEALEIVTFIKLFNAIIKRCASF